jgi:hypothetical protein
MMTVKKRDARGAVMPIRPGAHDAIESQLLWDTGYGFMQQATATAFNEGEQHADRDD